MTPEQWLTAHTRAFPRAWKEAEALYLRASEEGRPWPDWCFLPLDRWLGIVSPTGPAGPAELLHCARLAALGAWRYGKGIYSLDEELFRAVVSTPLEQVPSEPLMHLPEWCVYVETPGLGWFGDPLAGFFAHLESDWRTGRVELRLVLNAGDDILAPIPLHLAGTVEQMCRSAICEAADHAARATGVPTPRPSDEEIAEVTEEVRPLLSLLLYICSHAVDWPDRERPARPTPARRGKKGPRLFAARQTRRWELGKKVGEQIRHGRAVAATGTRASVTPHVRRAHWHGYWRGPRDGDRTFELRWLPPIFVGGE